MRSCREPWLTTFWILSNSSLSHHCLWSFSFIQFFYFRFVFYLDFYLLFCIFLLIFIFFLFFLSSVFFSYFLLCPSFSFFPSHYPVSIFSPSFSFHFPLSLLYLHPPCCFYYSSFFHLLIPYPSFLVLSFPYHFSSANSLSFSQFTHSYFSLNFYFLFLISYYSPFFPPLSSLP